MGVRKQLKSTTTPIYKKGWGVGLTTEGLRAKANAIEHARAKGWGSGRIMLTRDSKLIMNYLKEQQANKHQPRPQPQQASQPSAQQHGQQQIQKVKSASSDMKKAREAIEALQRKVSASEAIAFESGGKIEYLKKLETQEKILEKDLVRLAEEQREEHFKTIEMEGKMKNASHDVGIYNTTLSRIMDKEGVSATEARNIMEADPAGIGKNISKRGEAGMKLFAVAGKATTPELQAILDKRAEIVGKIGTINDLQSQVEEKIRMQREAREKELE